MKCGKCSYENNGVSRFCESCGASLTIKCSACSADNPPNAKFCEQCAKPFPGTRPAPAKSPDASPTPKEEPVHSISSDSRAGATQAKALSKWQIVGGLAVGVGMVAFMATRDKESAESMPVVAPAPSVAPASSVASKRMVQTLSASSPIAIPAPTSEVNAPAEKSTDAISASSAEHEEWVVRLDSYAEAGSIDLLLSKLKSAGLPVYTETSTLSQGVRTNVRSGPYPSIAMAEKARDTIRSLVGVEGVVEPRSIDKSQVPEDSSPVRKQVGGTPSL